MRNEDKARALLRRLRSRIDWLEDGGKSIATTQRAIVRVKKLYGFDKVVSRTPCWLSVYEM